MTSMPRLDSPFGHTNHFNTRLGIGVGVAIALLILLWVIKLLLPWLLLMALFSTGWYFWQRHHTFQQRLYRCFYECLTVHHGQISALDFAMSAQITGPQARAFLDARAQDFFADFEPTTYGDILYTFRPAIPASPSASPHRSRHVLSDLSGEG
jgi:hypothetical protein